MQSVIDVNLPQQSYKIAIAAQGLDQLESMTSLNLGKKVLVVSNPTIERTTVNRIPQSAGFEVMCSTLQRVSATKRWFRFKKKSTTQL